jgi:hypothetical protein
MSLHPVVRNVDGSTHRLVGAEERHEYDRQAGAAWDTRPQLGAVHQGADELHRLHKAVLQLVLCVVRDLHQGKPVRRIDRVHEESCTAQCQTESTAEAHTLSKCVSRLLKTVRSAEKDGSRPDSSARAGTTSLSSCGPEGALDPNGPLYRQYKNHSDHVREVKRTIGGGVGWFSALNSPMHSQMCWQQLCRGPGTGWLPGQTPPPTATCPRHPQGRGLPPPTTMRRLQSVQINPQVCNSHHLRQC